MAMRSGLVLFLLLRSSRAAAPTAQDQEQLAFFSDLRVLFTPAPDGRFENRVGFNFASLALDEYVHRPDEGEPSLGGTQSRIRNVSQMLLKYPMLRVHIDAHVGLSAPCMIAQPYSEERASLVAFELEALGVPSERITTSGWGKTVTEVALTSAHPNSASAKSGYGWAEMFFILDAPHSERQRVLPPRPDYYADIPPTSATRSEVNRDAEASIKLTRDAVVTHWDNASPSSPYPVFYMQPVTEVGAYVNLHFEPRHKVLISRAWRGSRKFIYCSDPPLASASPAEGFLSLPPGSSAARGKCALVKVDNAVFFEDGRTVIAGHRLKHVELVETDWLLELSSVPASGTVSAADTSTLIAPLGLVAWSKKLLLYVWNFLEAFLSWKDSPQIVQTTTETQLLENIPDSHIHASSDKQSLGEVHFWMQDFMHPKLPDSLHLQSGQIKIIVFSFAVLCGSCLMACFAARRRGGCATSSDGGTERPAPHPLLVV